jgi:hypothetical protein
MVSSCMNDASKNAKALYERKNTAAGKGKKRAK